MLDTPAVEGPAADGATALRDATAGDSAAMSATAETKDEGWVISEVRAVAPLLADLLVHGFEATLGKDLLTLAGEWVAQQLPSFDLTGTVTAFSTGLADLLALLHGAWRGDMACCVRISAVASSLTGMLADWQTAKGPLFDLRDQLEAFGNQSTLLFAGLIDRCLAEGAAVAQQLGLDGLTAQVERGLGTLGAIATAPLDAALRLLGWPTLAELPGWLLERAGAFLEQAQVDGSAALDSLAGLAMNLPGMDNLADIGDGLALAARAAAWMAENWGDPEVWDTDGPRLKEEFGALASGMEVAMRAWGAVQGGVDQLASGVETARGYADALVTHPLFAPLMLIPGVNLLGVGALLLARADDPLWNELFAAGATVTGWISTAAELVAEVVVVTAGAMNPVTALAIVPGLLLGAVSWLPDCYQLPIIDLLIGIVAPAAFVLTLPLAALGGIPALLSHGVEGLFTRLAGLDLEAKKTLLADIAAFLRLSFVVDLVGGLLVGVVEGLWDEIVGLVELVVGVLALIGASTMALPALATTVFAAVTTGASAIRDRARRANAPPEAPAAEPTLSAPEPVDPTVTAPAAPAAFDGFADALGRGWALLTEGAEALGGKIADGIVAFVADAEAGAYTLGTWAGWLVATLAFEILLTKGASAVAGALPKLAKLLETVVALSAKVDNALDALLGPLARLAGLADNVLGELFDAFQKLPLPFVDDIARRITRWREQIAKWFEELLAAVTKRADDAHKPHADGPDARKKADDDDPNLRAEVAAVWHKLAKATDDDLLAPGELASEAQQIARSDPDVRTVRIDKLGKDAWEADVTLDDGGRGDTPDGSLYHGEHGGDFFGSRDVRDENRRVALDGLDDLEDAWQALCNAQLGPKKPTALADALDREAEQAVAPKHQSKLEYARDILLRFDLGLPVVDGLRYEVEATAILTPNTRREPRRLVYTTTSSSPDNAKRPFAVSQSRREHILEGDTGFPGSGHGPNRKSRQGSFPDTWSDDQAIAAIERVANGTASTWKQTTGPGTSSAVVSVGSPSPSAPPTNRLGRPTRFSVRGQDHGITVEVIVEPNGEGIITGYVTQR